MPAVESPPVIDCRTNHSLLLAATITSQTWILTKCASRPSMSNASPVGVFILVTLFRLIPGLWERAETSVLFPSPASDSRYTQCTSPALQRLTYVRIWARERHERAKHSVFRVQTQKLSKVICEILKQRRLWEFTRTLFQRGIVKKLFERHLFQRRGPAFDGDELA